MRLRTHDEYYDPKKLAEGRQAIRDRLEAFLDARAEGDGDGWAPVDLEDHRELHEIFDQIISLKWGTDADGDLPINYATVNRNDGHLVSEVVPYEPRDRDLEGKTPGEIAEIQAKYQADVMRSAQYLLSSGSEILRIEAFRASDRYSAIHEQNKKRKERDEFVAIIAARDTEEHYEEDKAKAIHFSKEVFKNENGEMLAIHDAMAHAYPDALEAESLHIMRVMSKFNDDNAPHFAEVVRQPRTAATHAFGAHYAGGEVNRRANELYQAGRLVRAEERRAAAEARKKPTTA